MNRKRIARIVAGSLACALLIAAAAMFVVLRSGWFHEAIRARVVGTIETATGGRVSIRSFRFDWQRLRVEIRDFTLRGTEPLAKPPLLHADSVALGLKVVSVLRRKVDIAYLDVAAPHVYLIVGPDGGTNIPEPKVKRRGGRNAMDELLDLAVGRFSVQRGLFEVESRGAVPFEASGRNLGAALSAVAPGGGYRGTLAIDPLDARWNPDPAAVPIPLEVNASFALTRGRIEVSSATVATGQSRVDLSGAVDDLATPAGSFHYRARVAAADVARISRVPRLAAGWFELGGQGRWSGATAASLGGDLHVYGLEYRDSALTVRNVRAEGNLAADADGVELSRLNVSGDAGRWGRADARIARATLRGHTLDLEAVALAALGGSFHGRAQLRDLERFSAQGEIAGFLASRLVATYSSAPLPWDGRVSGAVSAEGSLARRNRLRAAATVDISPEAGRPPVEGRIEAAWDAAAGTLDLGRSTLALPSSRAEFSGVVGRQLRVRVTTRDLNDLLPALGKDAGALPVRLEHGSARFDGTVNGPLADPRIAGSLSATGVNYAGRAFDSVEGEVNASSDNVSLTAADFSRGGLRAQFQLAVALHEWQAGDSSQIFGDATIRNGRAEDVTALAAAPEIPLTGPVAGSARITGTVGDPLLDGDFQMAGGAVEGEPFDRFTGRIHVSGRGVDLSGGQLSAGSKRLTLGVRYEPVPDQGQGRIHFKAATNRMPLSEVRTLEQARPGVGGTAEITAAGALDVARSANGLGGIRIAGLDGEISLRDLQLDGRPAGDARITAKSEGQVLRASLQSDFAGSKLRGEGQWRLEGDYPGGATVTFSKVDFTELSAWLGAASPAAANRVTGSAEGELRIDGPGLDWRRMKAQLRIPALELRPVPGNGTPRGVAFRNAGTIVVNLANGVATVESARLEGPSSDLRLTGKFSLLQKNSLDARVNGRVEMGILGMFYPGVDSSGSVTADATIRGSLSDPQIGGRLQLENASLSVPGLPNGIENARGVILFTGDRATIQTLSGETGGGKVEFTGFAGFGGGELMFRLHARAEAVRVRYPEGVSTVANANLTFTGTSERSMIAGSVTVLRTGFNPQSDFSSVLAKSAEPVRTRSAGTGILGGLNFDIQINTAPDVQVESSLTQDVGVEANLRLRGTFGSPALLGRVNITQGQLLFFGSKYNITQGSVSFFNPVRVEPVLDIDLETKARGIEVTLNVSGPLSKLNMTPRSDPPLQFNEIVALLATGQAPTTDPAQVGRQTSPLQPLQQSGASAILGQAIASPVTGRLQRFFGVSRLRIDPTLPGVVYNPQARVTLEQQITPEITFTYITVVTSSNPQVVSMEWNFSRPWSVVAVREENGLFGLDFFFKKRFK